MPVFICAISTEGRDPAAYALLEQSAGPEGSSPTYTVRDVGRFDDEKPHERLADLLASGEEMTGRTVIVASGGRPTAAALAKSGFSCVPVEIGTGASRDGDTMSVAEQTLIDTFQAVYRNSIIDTPGALDHLSEAIHALYNAMSIDAGAGETPEAYDDLGPEGEGADAEERDPADHPNQAIIEQSGGAASISTARVGGRDNSRDMLQTSEADVDPERSGRVDDRARATGSGAELGEPRDIALALALAVWYGEKTADEIPTTDQAGQTQRARSIKRSRQEAARSR